MKKIHDELRRIRKEQANQLAVQEARFNELARYNGQSLRPTQGNSRSRYYYFAKKANEKKRYIGNASSADVINICEYHYLSKSLEILKKNIKAIDSFLDTFSDCDFEAVLDLLPQVYQILDAPPHAPLSTKAEEWLDEMNQLKSRYDTAHPQDLKIRTNSGIFVRSKSEALIANLYDQYGIPYVYEFPHSLNGRIIRCDFTILSPRDCESVILHEHIGLLGNEEYEESYLWKLKEYLSARYIANTNLFFTFDDPNGGFDIRSVQSIIDSHLI